MSGSETENNENDEKSSKSKKVYIKRMKDVKQLPLDRLHEYIESLHWLIRQHEKKQKRYKDKIRKLVRSTWCLKYIIYYRFKQLLGAKRRQLQR